MEYSIREMKKRDIPAIVELEKLVFPDPWSAAAFEDGLDFEYSGGCVAETADISESDTIEKSELEIESTIEPAPAIVGYACFYSAAGETHLTNIAVTPKLRRKKIARALLEAVFAEAAFQDSDAIFLEVRASNTPAKELYARYGFVELYTRKAYYSNPPEDATVFVCELKKPDENKQSAQG